MSIFRQWSKSDYYCLLEQLDKAYSNIIDIVTLEKF